MKTFTVQPERMWAGRWVQPYSGMRISKEYAWDHGMANPETYPSWPEYPDARDRPEAAKARAEFAARVKGVWPPHKCETCGEKHLTASYPWHDEAARLMHFQEIAEKTHMSVAEVERRLARIPDMNSGQAPIPDTISGRICALPGCQRLVPPRVSAHGRLPKWCSDAHRKRAARV